MRSKVKDTIIFFHPISENKVEFTPLLNDTESFFENELFKYGKTLNMPKELLLGITGYELDELLINLEFNDKSLMEDYFFFIPIVQRSYIHFEVDNDCKSTMVAINNKKSLFLSADTNTIIYSSISEINNNIMKIE